MWLDNNISLADLGHTPIHGLEEFASGLEAVAAREFFLPNRRTRASLDLAYRIPDPRYTGSGRTLRGAPDLRLHWSLPARDKSYEARLRDM
jgi:hypothetical protein